MSGSTFENALCLILASSSSANCLYSAASGVGLPSSLSMSFAIAFIAAFVCRSSSASSASSGSLYLSKCFFKSSTESMPNLGALGLAIVFLKLVSLSSTNAGSNSVTPIFSASAIAFSNFPFCLATLAFECSSGLMNSLTISGLDDRTSFAISFICSDGS